MENKNDDYYYDWSHIQQESWKITKYPNEYLDIQIISSLEMETTEIQ